MMKKLLACMVVAACHNSSGGTPDAKAFHDAPPSGSGSAIVVGTIAGETYTIVEALSVADIATNGVALVVLATEPGACARIAADTVHPNEKFITLTMSDTTANGSNVPTTPGTYTVATTVQPKDASFDTEVFDATCSAVQNKSVDGTSGTITLTAINGNVFSGSFDVTFSVTGDHVTGTFSPVSCANLSTVGPNPTCT
jgi:hypothetical protein